jgi:prophage regulatory protein
MVFTPHFPDEVLRYPSIHQITGASRTTIWRWERAGCFPRRVKLGPRGVGWLRSEVEDFLRSRPRSELKRADV